MVDKILCMPFIVIVENIVFILVFNYYFQLGGRPKIVGSEGEGEEEEEEVLLFSIIVILWPHPRSRNLPPRYFTAGLVL